MGDDSLQQAQSTSSTMMTEVVGAAVPVLTPLSIQLKNGTIAAKPYPCRTQDNAQAKSLGVVLCFIGSFWSL